MGSTAGAWATAAAKLAAENIAKPDKQAIFQPSIKMWVYEEAVNGRKLSQIVNEEHQNAKYLPGVTLPSNIVACPDLKASTLCEKQAGVHSLSKKGKYLLHCPCFTCANAVRLWLLQGLQMKV